jgi:hypothetical protein
LTKLDQSWPDLTKLNKIWPNLTRLDKTWQNLTRLDKNWQKLTKLDKNWQKLTKIDKNWPSLTKIDQAWQKLIKIYKTWPDLTKFDQTLPDLAKLDQTLPLFFFTCHGHAFSLETSPSMILPRFLFFSSISESSSKLIIRSFLIEFSDFFGLRWFEKDSLTPQPGWLIQESEEEKISLNNFVRKNMYRISSKKWS